MGSLRTRELATEGAVSVGFLAAAIGLAAALGDGEPLRAPLAVWLVVLCVVVLQIEFDVSEGRTRPVQLIFVPMLLLLPPADVPLLVAAAHLISAVPAIARGRATPERALLTLADSWFSVPPALLLAVAGPPAGALAGGALLLLAALVAQIASDFAVSAVRLRVGLQLDIRPELTAFAWIYLTDALLAPIGLLAAFSADEHPVAIAAVLPLAGLLAVFARERRGRLQTAAQLQRETEASGARLQAIVQNSSDLVAVLERDGTIRSLTGAVTPIFGAAWQDAVGTNLLDRAHPDDRGHVGAYLGAVAHGRTAGSREAEWRMRHAGGGWRHVETVATNLLGDERLDGIVLTARDVDDRKAFEEQLRHRAFHDPLTQLANRALFYDRIEHALTRESRGEQLVAVLFVDLDDFKLINDELGHAVGDELLTVVARRLRGCVRSADTAARLGGDEFGVLLEAVAGPNEPVQLAERLLAAFAEPVLVQGRAIAVPLSIGVAVSPQGERGVDELLRRADLAMYTAKRHGKRRWELYDARFEAGAPEHGGEDPERTTWYQRSGELREEVVALLERPDAVTPVFQPILDLRTGLVAGFEALARFNTPEQRPPNAWFAQAHRCGLGFELEAVAVAAAQAVPGRPAGAYLTLNLSPSALASAQVQAVLPESLAGLVIEVTENELLSEDPAIAAALADVRARGGRIAVDDAGAGYAGLKHIMRLAPDLIKLDRSLVAGVHGDPVRGALIESFVRYAREISATVCAEGIETLEDLRVLADLDVAYGQGYVIARPAPPWAQVAGGAAEACATSFTATLVETRPRRNPGEPHDRRLERVTELLSRARTRAAVDAALVPIAEDLGADEAVLVPAAAPTGDGARRAALEERRVVQVLAGDPSADPRERAAIVARGFRSALFVPVLCEDAVLGALEVFSRAERPWSRFEIRRARMLAHQLGAAVERIDRRDDAAYSR